MASLSTNSLYLAGFTLAHAVWSVSDTAIDELLCPLAVVAEGDDRRMLRFEAESQERAIQVGKVSMGEWQSAGITFAFAREGQWRLAGPDTEAEDVLTVDFWASGMEAPQAVLQPFRRGDAARAFRIAPRPLLVLEDRIIPDQDARAAIDVILEGVQSHPAVATLWLTWAGSPPPRDA
jgi:hypothetical protein